MNNVVFQSEHLKAISKILAESAGGLSHKEVTYALSENGMLDGDSYSPKWARIFNGFAESLNRTQSAMMVIAFIESAANPVRFLNNAEDYEPFRQALNRSLALVELAVSDSGIVSTANRVTTLPEAERRAKELRADLLARRVHPDVLVFCRAELLDENYFHAVQEAMKSIARKMRARTGLLDDGAVLVNHVYGGQKPILTINRFHTRSEKDQQKGFCNLLIGMFGMFRNPTAHEARVFWPMSKDDAEDLLTLVSLVHRRIDGSVMPSRV